MVICECDETGMLHLCDTTPPTQSLCGLQIINATMIPLRCWGNADSTWCDACAQKSQPDEEPEA